jgi:hypothetical protein
MLLIQIFIGAFLGCAWTAIEWRMEINKEKNRQRLIRESWSREIHPSEYR